MFTAILSILAGGVGLLLAHLLSRPVELRRLRLSQLILVPVAMAGAVWFLPMHPGKFNLGDLQNFIQYLFIAAFVAVLLAPNIAYHVGIGFTNLIDPHDWTPLKEEIALRPIQRMIDREQYQEALAELDQLLAKHKPTYEALLLKSKLLHHFSSVDETAATLLQMIRLSHSTHQQLSVMDALASLEGQLPNSAGPFIQQTRRIRIDHELVLFPEDSTSLSVHQTIPPGEYDVKDAVHGAQRWYKLPGKNLGNAKICWEAVEEKCAAKAEEPVHRFLQPIARMHRAISEAIAGRGHFQKQAQAAQLLKEANFFIRQEDWARSVPLLEKASDCDPDSYEIAYRLMQAVRHTASPAGSPSVLRRLLNQSRWSDSERAMLQRD
jgi:thioredoxin-like negative regulator of GroEL